MPTTYQVQLPLFSGPLDLLLHLVEREELEITAISLAQVTDQYLAYMALLEHLDAAELADFLVVAARLLLIKSRALLPRPADDRTGLAGEEEEDPGDALVRQLRAYKQFKEAALHLREREQAGLRAYVRLAPPPRIEPGPEHLEPLPLTALVEAAQQALALRPADGEVGQVVSPYPVTIHEQMALIRRTLTVHSRISFRRLLSQAASRQEIIVTLLAVLELIKQHEIEAHQKRLFGDILLIRGRHRPTPAPSPADGTHDRRPSDEDRTH